MHPALPLAVPYLPPPAWYAAWTRWQLGLGPAPALDTVPNRGTVTAPWGPQTLSVPIEGGRRRLHDTPYALLRLSEHGGWRHAHWEAIISALGSYPLFHYFEAEFAPVYTSGPVPTLAALCASLHAAMLRCSRLEESIAYLRAHPEALRALPRRPLPAPAPLSALELLCLTGPEIIFCLCP